MSDKSNILLPLDDEAEVTTEDNLPVDERVRLAYGEADLGTRFIISGGEVLELVG